MNNTKRAKMKNPEVGNIYRCKNHEGLEVISLTHGLNRNKFQCRVRSAKDGTWTDYYLEGEAFKLKAFLIEQEAIWENEPEEDKKVLESGSKDTK